MLRLAARSCSRRNHFLTIPLLGRRICYFQATMALRGQFLAGFEDTMKPLFEVPEPRLKSVMERLEESIRYNTMDGKLTRGCAVLHTTNLLGHGADKTDKAIILGWCIEMLQGFLLVADDIMDNSLTRRGKPCWFRKMGLSAVNDSILLESSVYEILRSHLRDDPCYLACLELFLEVTRSTSYGQSMDLESETADLSEFTMERYDTVAEYKTARYSFYLPVALAMHLCGRNKPEELQAAQTILLKIGHYFQVQDDYLDVFGDPEVIGKIGTDIQERKCSWLFITALSLASEEQKSLLATRYGNEDAESVAMVKDLYRSLSLRDKYLEYSAKVYQEISALIAEDKSGLPKEIFQDFLDAIHKRSK